MPLFGSAALQGHFGSSESRSTTVVTTLQVEPASTSVSRVIENASGPGKLDTSSRSQTNQNSDADVAPVSSQADTNALSNISSSPYVSPPITLIIGGPSCRSPQTPQTIFYVHSDLLTSVSPFFRAAFDNHNSQTAFLEASALTMRLPEERPEDVAYLLQWLYSPKGLPAVQTLHHELIDIPLRKMEEYKCERAVVQHVEKHGNISQLISPRPAPPAFGPLIRLYILADRLSVDGGLKGEICKRVREVGALAAAVPRKDDVWRLWEGVPKVKRRVEKISAGDTSDVNAKSRECDVLEEDLKGVVLDMYADMRGWAVFEEVDDGDEGFDWHSLFMRGLVIRLLREKREMRGEATRLKIVNCKCENKNGGGEGKYALNEA